MSITAPESTPKVRFEVYWTANAAASGVLRYTVEYSGAMDSAWQPWLPSTTETSGMFTAPVADTEYAFRVTVYDRAGNSAWAQTSAYVEPQRLYLPVLLERWRDWYRYDIYELNDTPPDAYGPLKDRPDVSELYLECRGPERLFLLCPEQFTGRSGSR